MTTDRDDEQLNQPEGPPHDAVGAYLLDALPEEERAAFAAHLVTCESCRREVAQLTPVVALLPRLLELDLDVEEEADASRGAPLVPSPALRDRILEAARAEGRPAAEPAVVAEPGPVRVMPELPEPVESPVAAQEPIAFPPQRPRGRIRGGMPSAPGTAPATPWETMGRFSRGWLAAAVLAIVAVGSIIWVLALQGTIDDKDREIAALRERASAWNLGPGSANPASQSGTLLYSALNHTGALIVQNMPALPADQVYQSWLIKTGNDPVPGPTFTVDDTGTGAAPMADPNTPTFNVVAVTREPKGGSVAPTSEILLQGQLSGVAGLPGLGIASAQLTPPDLEQP